MMGGVLGTAGAAMAAVGDATFVAVAIGALVIVLPVPIRTVIGILWIGCAAGL